MSQILFKKRIVILRTVTLSKTKKNCWKDFYATFVLEDFKGMITQRNIKMEPFPKLISTWEMVP